MSLINGKDADMIQRLAFKLRTVTRRFVNSLDATTLSEVADLLAEAEGSTPAQVLRELVGNRDLSGASVGALPTPEQRTGCWTRKVD